MGKFGNLTALCDLDQFLVSLCHFIPLNRICCGYGPGSYSLTIVKPNEDEQVLEGGEFAYLESLSFGGDCVALKTDPKPEPSACVDVNLTLTTDDYPDEISVNLSDLTYGDVFWADTVIDQVGTLYEWNQCIDPQGCHRLNILDSYGTYSQMH